jgi:Domain of unknown function (DUF3472)/Domain of unknown function (DUF5077)
MEVEPFCHGEPTGGISQVTMLRQTDAKMHSISVFPPDPFPRMVHGMYRRVGMTLVSLFLTGAQMARGAGTNAPDAARSVHLGWTAPKGDIFYNEVRVRETTPQTYFCVCGFSHGYYGIQDLGPDRPRILLFSVWDPGQQDDPRAVAETNRVELLFKDAEVRVGRFGGEGTGGQSFLDLPWKTNQVVRLLVHSKVEGLKTSYSGYLYDDDKARWRHLITFRTRSKGDALQGYYSFVEDFRRDGKSPQERRVAEFGLGWVHTLTGEWVELTRARFTGDSTPLMNVDAGAAADAGWFFLKTGGAVTNSTTELWKVAERPSAGAKPPELLSSFVPENP